MTDPYLIESWTDYCAECITTGQQPLFRRHLAEYIRQTNYWHQRDLMRFVRGIQGEIMGEEIRMQARRLKNVQRFKGNRLI